MTGLIVQDWSGAHNSDLEKTTARLIKGGSWKRQRIAVIIPSGDMIPAKVALSLWNLGFPPNNGVVRILAEGMEVGEAYSNAIEQILGHPQLSEWEFVLTIEHDNLVPSDGVIKLVEHMEAHPEFACISGLYFTKGPGGVCQIWGDPSDPIVNFRPQAPRLDGGLVECCGTGMGFALWRISMFKDKNIKRPWFRTVKGKEGFGTQDLVFWGEARKWGYRCAVACDVKSGHLDFTGEYGPKGMVW